MTKSTDEVIAEIRRVLTEEPTDNHWLYLVSLVESVQGAEREAVIDYVKQHVSTGAWKSAWIPFALSQNEVLIKIVSPD